MSTRALVLLLVIFVILGFVVAPAAVMPVAADETAQTYRVDVFRPVVLTLTAFAFAAVFGGMAIRKLGRELGTALNPLPAGVGLVAFGLFYALHTAYREAADALGSRYITWIEQFESERSMEYCIPEYQEKFRSAAGNYALLMFLSLAIVAAGIVFVILKLRKRAS